MLVKDLPLYEDENWECIVDFTNYIITDYGRVFNLNTGKELHPSHTKGNCDKIDYLEVHLCKKGKVFRFKVHRLVAKYFVVDYKVNPDGTKMNGPHEVNHKDLNPLNNHYSNLEWCDHAYNNRHKTNSKYSHLSLEELIELRSKQIYRSKLYNTLNSLIKCRRKYLRQI